MLQHKSEIISNIVFYLTIFIFISPLSIFFVDLIKTLQIFISSIALRFVLQPFDSDVVTLFYEHFGKDIGILKNQVIWITGSSSGMGEELAVHLAQVKLKLILTARSEKNLEKVKARCLQVGVLNKEDILVLPFDITEFDKHQTAFAKVIEKFEKLDILVSNAGMLYMCQVEKSKIENEKHLFELNVFSMVGLCKVVHKYFRQRNQGHHVLISSLGGIVGVPYRSSYCASKQAAQAYFESLKYETMEKGISITVLNPGVVKSKFMLKTKENSPDVDSEELYQKVLLKSMSLKRFSELCGIVIANKIEYSWIGGSVELAFAYIRNQMPLLFIFVFKRAVNNVVPVPTKT